jgi:hypothetical protein
MALLYLPYLQDNGHRDFGEFCMPSVLALVASVSDRSIPKRLGHQTRSLDLAHDLKIDVIISSNDLARDLK